MNKKIKLTSIALVCTGAMITASIIFANDNSLYSGLIAANDESEIWGHYSALEPEYEKPGSKEFWISCSTHSIRFEAPTTGIIQNRGNPTVKQIESWGSSDGRYVPQYKIDNSHIWYGYYPQTNVDDSSLISILDTLTNPNEFGYYLYSGEYYHKYSATPYDTGYTFDNGTTIVSGTSYWFKVEPIKWKVLENKNGTYLITTESILVNHEYSEEYVVPKLKTDYQGNAATVYANNYKYSDIRNCLNTDFYSQAFFFDKNNIIISTVDNTVASTLCSTNKYVCEDTKDKLFLLSAKELTTSTYGYNTSVSVYDMARCCLSTDYLKAHGGISHFSMIGETGCYYTRSPYDMGDNAVYYVGDFGCIDFVNLSHSSFGVCPALRLSF